MSNKAHLTVRQIECLRRIAAGQTSLEFAHALGLSRHTVDHYIGGACERLQARSRAHAVAVAISRNLLSLQVENAIGE